MENSKSLHVALIILTNIQISERIQKNMSRRIPLYHVKTGRTLKSEVDRAQACVLPVQEIEVGTLQVQGLPGLQSEFKVSLSHLVRAITPR